MRDLKEQKLELISKIRAVKTLEELNCIKKDPNNLDLIDDEVAAIILQKENELNPTPHPKKCKPC